jgi:hypothetical protein
MVATSKRFFKFIFKFTSVFALSMSATLVSNFNYPI